MKTPKISIITVVRDGMPLLRDCVESVQRQSFTDYEYIFVEGGSHDGTLEYLQSVTSNKAQLITGADQGIGDAMNRGLKAARGDWILFLHADDYLEDAAALQRIAPHLDDPAPTLCFDIWHEDDRGQRQRRKPRGFTSRMAFKTGVFHQACLCRTDLLRQMNGFDPSYRITMDYDFFYRAWRTGAIARCIPETFSVMRLVGISSQQDWPTLKLRFGEEQKVHRKHCPNMAWRIVYGVYWALYWPYRKLLYLRSTRS